MNLSGIRYQIRLGVFISLLLCFSLGALGKTSSLTPSSERKLVGAFSSEVERRKLLVRLLGNIASD